MNVSSLLNDKFAAAAMPEVCAPRKALLSLFDREAEKRVIYVSAPGGYGKTISTQLWLKNSGRIPIWMSLDEYDSTLSIFYKFFCTGVLSVQPDNKAMANILSSASFASTPVEHTIRILSEFVPDDKQYVVVLDDMHLITSKEIRKSGLLVQKRLPTSFVVVVLTRNEIAEEYIAITGKEKCAAITAQDLAFSKEEVKNYFNTHGCFITEKEAESIHDATNGWPIGINALAMSGQFDLEHQGGQLLENYIKTQIWDKWTEDLQRFLLQTAVVDEMQAKLCNKLTGREDSDSLLESLSAQNFFVNRIGENTYRYHHLYLDFFRNILEQTDEFDIKTLYKTVADYYLEENKTFFARQYAIKSGDSEAIANSINSTGKSGSVDEFANVYRSFLKDPIPIEICNQHPYLYSQYIAYYFLIGDARKTEYYMDMLYEHMPVIARAYTNFMESSSLMMAMDYRCSLAELAERLGTIPITTKSVVHQQWVSISLQMPYGHRSIRDFSELADEKSLEKFISSFGPLLKSQSNIVALLLRAGFLYEQNLLNRALEAAMQTKNAISGETADELVFCSFIQLASIYYELGKDNLLTDIINQTEQYIEESGSNYFYPNFEAFKAKLLLMNGDKAAAIAWLDNYFVTDTEQMELYKIFQHFTTARAYTVLGQTNKAMEYIFKLKKLATDFRRPLDTAEASVLQAILEWTSGNKKEALNTLETALISMQGYRFARVFADEGAAILPILKKLAINPQKDCYQSSLDSRFLNEVTIAAYEQSKRHKGISVNIRTTKPVKLSSQQKNMIALLSKGYKNQEIVEITGLSIHTVKSHLAAAYAKLEVNNAMDAVLKAKELGIIK